MPNVVRALATATWKTAEFLNIRLLFPHIVFGLMIGRKGIKQ